jgi:hypothetical protein
MGADPTCRGWTEDRVKIHTEMADQAISAGREGVHELKRSNDPIGARKSAPCVSDKTSERVAHGHLNAVDGELDAPRAYERASPIVERHGSRTRIPQRLARTRSEETQ